MNLKEMTDALLFWVSQWVGVTLPLIATLVLGLALGVAAVTAVWTRRIRMVPALLILFAGAFLVMISLDTGILHWAVATDYLTRIRLVMGLLSILVMGVTFEAVRRSRLKERYAILWMFTGGVILLCSLFPAVLEFLTALLGMQYVTAVGVVMFAFFLMVLFHVSLALSNLQEDETATAQRCALLEARLEQVAAELDAIRGRARVPPDRPAPVSHLPPVSPDSRACGQRTLRGFVVGVPLLILSAALAVLWSGLQAPQAMVGDEVTHYHMLVHQAETLPQSTFESRIPTGRGIVEVRNYPHANLWHYAGAWGYRWTQSFAAIQVYQTLFLVQLLVAAFFLIRRRPGASTPAILLYLLVLASLPITLIFSMTFYQDVPVTAQVVTAFCLLDRRRWVWATVFMMAALGFKETAVLFVPAFLALLSVRRWESARETGTRVARAARVAVPLAISCVLLWYPMHVTDRLLKPYGGYYPFRQLTSISTGVAEVFSSRLAPAPQGRPDSGAVASNSNPISSYEAEIIANHPGDLRHFRNWALYGGVLIWWVMGVGAVRLLFVWRRPSGEKKTPAGLWPLWVGLSFLLPTAYLLKTAPDARFFLPAVPFLLLPFVESFSRLPRQRIWMSLLVALAIVQSGFVLSKVVRLRQVTPELKAGMAYLREYPPPHNRVFMYPEGNYRLFPVEHDWYLAYRLRDFWRGNNDFRLQLLEKHHVGAIVVKKHLVEPVDDAIRNLGVYPDYFIPQIEADVRFRKVFDNSALVIYVFDASGLPPLD